MSEFWAGYTFGLATLPIIGAVLLTVLSVWLYCVIPTFERKSVDDE